MQVNSKLGTYVSSANEDQNKIVLRPAEKLPTVNSIQKSKAPTTSAFGSCYKVSIAVLAVLISFGGESESWKS